MSQVVAVEKCFYQMIEEKPDAPNSLRQYFVASTVFHIFISVQQRK